MAGDCKACHLKTKSVDVDLAHTFETLLKETAGPDREITCHQPGASCYSFSPSEHELQIKHIEVCGRPMSFNSGSHRLLVEFSYQHEPYVMAIEEKESPACIFMGDIIHVGAFTAVGQSKLQDDSFIKALLPKIIYAATGVIADFQPVYEFDAGTSDITKESPSFSKAPRFYPRDRFILHRSSASEILRQGCTLSDEARGCVFMPKKETL
ncbi:MAG: hypothetical protein HY540_05975 [Deltaproteobacteria bacterium]|nr:hypothetical protein [Deltaproteobacteria bacterium]